MCRSNFPWPAGMQTDGPAPLILQARQLLLSWLFVCRIFFPPVFAVMFLCVNCFYQHHKKMFAFYGHIFFFFIVTLSPSLRQTLHGSFSSRIKWPFCFFSVFMATRLSFLTATLCLSVLLNSVTFFNVCKVFLCASSFLPGSFFFPSLSLFLFAFCYSNQAHFATLRLSDKRLTRGLRFKIVAEPNN